jgi:hypothetical protein
MLKGCQIYSGLKPFAELSSSLALARQVLAGTRPPRTEGMDGLKLTDAQWESITAAWDQEPSRRPVLSSGGEPMIHSWRSEIEAVQGASHQPDLSAEEALHALEDLTQLMRFSFGFGDAEVKILVKVFSFIVRSGRIPIRRHEDAELRWIHDCVRFKHEPADYNSPYWKIFLLLQTHFSRLPLSTELAADLAIVLERVFSLFSVCAHRHWSNLDSDLAVWPRPLFSLIRMCVHGMWDDDPQLKQIPHFEGGVSCSFKRQCLWLIHASGHQTIHSSRHLVGGRRREHECASTKRQTKHGRSEYVRQRAA